jgi:multicomponent Na+:H+ antiporter subunit D
VSDVMPAAPLLAGALLLPLLPRTLRPWLFVLAPALAFALLTRLQSGMILSWPFLSYELVLSRVDRLSLAFGYVFALVACLGAIFGFHLRDLGQQVAALLYAGAGLGVVFAGDWLTLYVFWEVLAVASAWLIFSARTEASGQAGMRYLMFHLLGGGVLLAGVLWQVHETGSLLFNRLESSGPAWLILLGFAVNAAVVPLHPWLPDAYPEAPVTGSVFLSAFTTKAAVYVLARGFPGSEVLLVAGTVMALYGVFYAVLENDIRRILSYHIVSQVGYMVAGIGIGTETAINGATAHAFAHILYKGLLFMAAGAVVHATGRRKLTDLGNLAGALPWVLVFYMFGALSISGFPLLSGFVSKSLVLHAAEIDHRDWVFLLLNAASVGTFLSVGLKLPYFTWFGAKQSIKLNSIPAGMYCAMALASGINLAIGLQPDLLYRVMPFSVDYHPYTTLHLVQISEGILFTGLAFWFFRRQMNPKAAVTLDVDWFYRKAAPWLRRNVVFAVDHFFAAMEGLTLAGARQLCRLGADPLALFAPADDRRRSLKRRPPDAKVRPYDPDRYRGPVGIALLIILGSFISLVGWSFLGAYLR